MPKFKLFTDELQKPVAETIQEIEAWGGTHVDSECDGNIFEVDPLIAWRINKVFWFDNDRRWFRLHPNALVYDAEIAKLIASGKGWQAELLNRYRREVRGYEFCGGWRDFEGMSISVVCAYDYWTRSMKTYTLETLSQFQRLASLRDTIIAFNGIEFDDKLMAANGVSITTNFDILRECYRAAGLDPFPEDKSAYKNPAYKGFGLNNLAKHNLGRGKIGRGDLAPIWHQQGKASKVVSYCKDDVVLEREIYERLMMSQLVSPNTNLTLIPGGLAA